jgi:hypothetical protein
MPIQQQRTQCPLGWPSVMSSVQREAQRADQLRQLQAGRARGRERADQRTGVEPFHAAPFGCARADLRRLRERGATTG